MARYPSRSLLILGVLVSLGCQAKPPASYLNLLVNPIDAQKIGFSYRWSRNLGTHPDGKVRHAVILSDVIVVVESPSNLVSALSLEDGELRWIRRVGTRTDRLFEPVRSGDRVLINSETQLFSLSIETGNLLDVQSLRTSVGHAPVLAHDLAIFGGTNGRVFAHDMRGGYPRWQYEMSSPIRARPVLTPNHAFVADTRGNYALLSVEAGTLLRPGRTFARISATPTATDVGILVASEDHTLYALHALTLHDRWKFRAPHALTLTPTILQDVVYLPVPNHGLIAIDANKGEKLWELRGVYAHPIHSAGHKVLMNAGKELILLNVNSGQTITRIATKPLKTVLRTPTGELILVGPDAWLMRLDRN